MLSLKTTQHKPHDEQKSQVALQTSTNIIIKTGKTLAEKKNKRKRAEMKSIHPEVDFPQPV